MSKSEKAKTVSKWVSTPTTRRNHEAIFNKTPYHKECGDCDCTGEYVNKLRGRVCQDCGKFTEHTSKCEKEDYV